jgi:hypothetical protein
MHSLSAGLVTAEGYAVSVVSWLVGVGSLLGDQSDTTLWSWSNSNSLSDFCELVYVSREIIRHTLSLTKPACYHTSQYFISNILALAHTFLLWMFVKLNGSLENRTPPLVLRLTKYEFWFPDIPKISVQFLHLPIFPSKYPSKYKFRSFRTHSSFQSHHLSWAKLTGDFPDQVRRHLLRVVRHFVGYGRRFRGNGKFVNLFSSNFLVTIALS